MGYEARDKSAGAEMRRRVARDDQDLRNVSSAQRNLIAGKRVLVQSEYPQPRPHAGRKSVRRVARIWVKP